MSKTTFTKRKKGTHPSTISSNYNALGLRRNPFSGQILPSDRPAIAPYEPIKKKIESFIRNFLDNRASRGMVFIGDYGTGKTYHLKWMKNKFDELQEANVRTIYLETPGLEPYDLVRGILSEIGEEQVAKGIWNLLQPVMVEEIRSVGQAAYFSQFAHEIQVKGKRQSLRTYSPSQLSFGGDYYGTLEEEDLFDHRKFLKAFDRSGRLSREKLRDHFAEKLLGNREPAITQNVVVARELASICFYSGAPALDSWERLVIPEASSTRSFPLQGEPAFLQAVVKVLVKSGIEYLVLFIDEFEKVPLLETMTEREAKRYLDTFRMLIDRNWHELPFAWVLGANEDAWTWIEKENRALIQRIVVKTTLPRMDDPKPAHYIVAQFLEQARLDGFPAPPGQPLYPFPDNLLDLIPLTVRRTPRDLVKLCDQILEMAVEQAHPKPPISEEVISVVLEGFALEESRI